VRPGPRSVAVAAAAATVAGAIAARAGGRALVARTERRLNGVAAEHYIFDEQALTQVRDAKSTGALWVAVDGNYIVRYILATTAGADYFGEGIEGTITWDYEVTDINQPFTLNLPQDCHLAIVDAPLLPDATDVLSVPGLLNYNTVTSLSDVVVFYQTQLPIWGWQPSNSPPTNETGALLNFTRSDQQLSVIIGVDDGSTSVNILSVPKNSVVPTRTPKPTRTPLPTRTPKPTRTPMSTRTPKPTRTPLPTRTPKPTQVPVTTPTLMNVNISTPTPTPKP